ncbi:APC family permease [Candidatus Azoamicus ciliaticola]|uniref:Glutamate/gamma-aminobutyrate antiporter n=1 Tax=Candidatus Azoamicus ciliaticola TaxID=2652803 RepID=A0A6J5JXS7_9GAMM|nr:APC family permease [Candidatus Azoamicus ciliaticola]CAB3976322.1 Glutamate/gamma-aminobutyrate antiporter [Candidatus Azoamicus ciliaticola]
MFNSNKKITLLRLVLLTVSGILSLKSLPLFAEVGFSIISFLLFATICFFIPIAMAISELSSTWPVSGGCYTWVKKSCGKSLAFIVIWSYWIQSIIWFPTMLIFIIAMLVHVFLPFFPDFKISIFFSVFGIIVIFWILTFLNFLGVRVSVGFSIFGVIFGTILPIILIILFGFFCLYFGYFNNIDFSFKSIIPDFNLNNLVFLSGILLGISGIELIAFYVSDVENPAVNLSKSIMISSFLILIFYALASLSVAIIMPKSEICFASGVILAFKFFFDKVGLPFLTPFLALLLFLGSIACVNTWIIGPARGLLVAASDGFLPNFMTKVNSKGVPVNLLLVQACVVSFLSVLFFLYINTINGLVWVFICLSFQFAAFLYVMIFISVLRLRKIEPNIHRPFKMPFVKFFSCVGICMCVFTFILSYVQPSDVNVTQKSFYFFLLFFSFIILMLPSFIFLFFKNKN